MEISSILFFILATIIVGSVIYILFTSDILRGLFAFALVTIGLAGMYVLLNAELVAVIQLMIYAGGIVVIMVFGIMLTKEITEKGIKTGHLQVFPAIIICLVVFGFGSLLVFDSTLVWVQTELHFDMVKETGKLFLTQHLMAFELIAFLLLAVLVGAAFVAQKSKENL